MSDEEIIRETVLYNMQDAKNVSCFRFYSNILDFIAENLFLFINSQFLQPI